MTRPHHGGPYKPAPGEFPPRDGWYEAFRNDNRQSLGRKWLTASAPFPCWPAPPECDITWSDLPTTNLEVDAGESTAGSTTPG